MIKKLWLLFAQVTTVFLAITLAVAAGVLLWHSADKRIIPPPAAPTATTTTQAVPLTILASKAVPAVVNILSRSTEGGKNDALATDPLFRHFAGSYINAEKTLNLGSGVIIDSRGYVLTNAHVIAGAQTIEISVNDGRKFTATLVGSDQQTDLAVLKLNSPLPLPKLDFAPTDQPQIGETVLAIGNPFGVGQTVTMGIISALRLAGLPGNGRQSYIQTDAAINPGNSGGALINRQGQLIGINTAIFSRSGGSEGIGFATPAATAKQVFREILQHGHVRRGWVGIGMEPLNAALAEAFAWGNEKAVLINAIAADSPAMQAGLKRGDLLVQINGHAVLGERDVQLRIAVAKPGDALRFAIQRQGKSLIITVKLAEQPVNSGEVY